MIATKDDYLQQIDADLKAGAGDPKELKARRKAVAAAKTDKAARKAYLASVERGS